MKRELPWMLLLLLGIIWGSNFLFMKMAVAIIPPLEVACLRTLFGALPIAGLAILTRSLHWGDWRYLHHFSAMAILANVGPYAFFVVGTQHLPSGIAGVVSGTVPFIAAATTAVALPAERLTRSVMLGITVGFAGVLLVTPLGPTGPLQAESSMLLGIMAILAGSVSYALALVYAKRFVAPLELGSIRLACYQMILAFVLLAPFVAPGHWPELLDHRTAMMALIIGLGLFGTGIAFVIYYYLIATLGALKTASVYYIPPVVALVIGAVFAHETVGLRQIGGALLIMGGIFCTNRPERASWPNQIAEREHDELPLLGKE